MLKNNGQIMWNTKSKVIFVKEFIKSDVYVGKKVQYGWSFSWRKVSKSVKFKRNEYKLFTIWVKKWTILPFAISILLSKHRMNEFLSLFLYFIFIINLIKLV